jgi:hypothetical protein
MSAALLLDPAKHQDFEDDLESFLHVLTWTSVRYCPSNLTAQERTTYLRTTFDEVDEKNGVCVSRLVKSGGSGTRKISPVRAGLIFGWIASY